MTQHTAGPWRVAAQGDGTRQLPILRPDGKIIAAIRNEGRLADAHLVGAAPELLEALRNLLTAVTITPSQWDQAAAALVKAEGNE